MKRTKLRCDPDIGTIREREVKITLINMLKTSVEKVNKIHEQMENFIREL